MGSLRTQLAGLTLVLGLGPVPLALAAPDLTPVFAVCTGRLSAVVEHHWLMARDPAQAEADYAAMGAVLAAVAHGRDGAEVMSWRITAKVALRQMLLRADLAGDSVAADRAAILIAECRDLIGQAGA